MSPQGIDRVTIHTDGACSGNPGPGGFGAILAWNGHEREFKGGENHFGNFVQAVRSRRPEDLHAEILEGHLSSALCHLANVSYRLGKPQPFNQKTKAFGDDKEAYETLARMEEYLKENQVNLDEAKYQLGPKLTIDAQAERVANNAAANKFLTREYRKPFAVPEKV